MARPQIRPGVFKEIENELAFSHFVEEHILFFCEKFKFELHRGAFSGVNVKNAHKVYTLHYQNAFAETPQTKRRNRPDNYLSAGALAFALQRFPPVEKVVNQFPDTGIPAVADEDSSVSPVFLFETYTAEFLAFNIGHALCEYFYNKGNWRTFSEKEFLEYQESVLYLMKFTHIPPQAMGSIFRSLYVPPKNSGA